jgi:membrane protein implicated in regulation of membrane protease activity
MVARDVRFRGALMSYEGFEDVVGKTAHVSVTIPGGELPGEVVVRVRGGSEAYIAYASEEVERGTQVLVVADRGARSVDVSLL